MIVSTMFNGIHSKSISSDRAGNRLKHLDDEIFGKAIRRMTTEARKIRTMKTETTG